MAWIMPTAMVESVSRLTRSGMMVSCETRLIASA